MRPPEALDVFLTGDRNLTFQQEVTKYHIAVIVLQAPSTQLHHTLPLIPKVLAALSSLEAGRVLNLHPCICSEAKPSASRRCCTTSGTGAQARACNSRLSPTVRASGPAAFSMNPPRVREA
jgi:hypothetical protein